MKLNKRHIRYGVLISFFACALFVGASAGFTEDATPTNSKANEAAVKSKEPAALQDAGKLKINEFVAKVNDSKSEIKQKEALAEKSKKEAEAVTDQKLILEKKVAEQEQAVISAETELKAVKSAAALEKAPETKQKTRELEEQLAQSKQEAKLLSEKLGVVEAKARAAEAKTQTYEQEAAVAKDNLAKLWQERVAKRPLVRKIMISLIIVLIGFITLFILTLGFKRFERAITIKDTMRESEKTLRLKTFSKLFHWLSGVAIFTGVIYALLGNFGIDASLLLAGAGIVGIAFGFGGQYLIRDVINGIFIMLEGQYRINDVVKIGDNSGLVEDINLRITTLRDLEGRVIVIPNGEIKTVINFTKDYSYALFNVGVAYKENADHVMEVIKGVGREMREDKHFKRLILNELEMFGVDDFADSQVTIKFRIMTLPIKQWEVAREFRRRLKIQFDALGIEIPFPHRTLYLGAGKDNEWLKSFAFQDKRPV